MHFGVVDFELMKLIGLCRYLPTELNKIYDSQLFTRDIISNLH